ncbi:hypothetical protein GCM10022198_25890 [Klugiella xanthotipulae]|uniref:Putative short-subunit dehydrogenase-like oxidoreductase (DUF2520 family) n=1 Tax=Klugiella xanthotipulae TaxID=244735 RepID=A0A543I5L5_9MICO|nr:DUF2520 domain-containing protein [Klugiella xanthotipulae]TQM65877.1 putative short-subunit dehydrogenase-like oxidoreductase (DUF2520 family) [Klugiella xanthotipulae]
MTVRSGRLGVGIVGAGRVGPVIGAALANAGHAVVGISAVSAESRERAEGILPGVPILAVEEILERSELVVLAVPTAELAGLVAGLAALGVWQSGQLVLHTAAEYGTGVLAPAAAAGAIPLAVHPAIVFTGTTLDLARLMDSYCAVTAPAPVLPIGQALVVEMGAEPVVIAEAGRAEYARALASVGELAGRVVADAAATLTRLGVESPAGLLASVLSATVDTVLRSHANPPEVGVAGQDSFDPGWPDIPSTGSDFSE